MVANREDKIFDYRLGYIRAGTALSGFDIIGENEMPRVLILGGYTTTAQAISKQTWADSLYGLIKADNRSIQLLNGDTDGFTSAQEMMMLMRDGILLKPELVICLSGFYNFAYKLGFVKNKEYTDILRDYPFTNLGQLEFYKYFTDRFGLGNGKMHYGEKNNLPAWEYWLGHVDIIHGICDEFDIKHMTFLQPCVFSGEYNCSDTEKEVIASTYNLTSKEVEGFYEGFQHMYKNSAQESKDRDYICDISGLFDDDSNVYTDACHVKGEYKKKVSEAIYTKISESIINSRGIKG